MKVLHGRCSCCSSCLPTGSRQHGQTKTPRQTDTQTGRQTDRDIYLYIYIAYYSRPEPRLQNTLPAAQGATIKVRSALSLGIGKCYKRVATARCLLVSPQPYPLPLSPSVCLSRSQRHSLAVKLAIFLDRCLPALYRTDICFGSLVLPPPSFPLHLPLSVAAAMNNGASIARLAASLLCELLALCVLKCSSS